jgi:hypothetical protein
MLDLRQVHCGVCVCVCGTDCTSSDAVEGTIAAVDQSTQHVLCFCLRLHAALHQGLDERELLYGANRDLGVGCIVRGLLPPPRHG